MSNRIAILDCGHINPIDGGPVTCVPSAATQTSSPLCMQRQVHVHGVGSGLRSILFRTPGRGLSRSRRAGGGEIHASAHAFFHSGERDYLQSDLKALLRLGRKFGQFDRQGKVSYVDEMKKMVESWKLAYTGMELFDDSSAKHCATQSKTAVGPLGLTNVDLAKSIILVLDEMRQDAESGH